MKNEKIISQIGRHSCREEFQFEEFGNWNWKLFELKSLMGKQKKRDNDYENSFWLGHIWSCYL